MMLLSYRAISTRSWDAAGAEKGEGDEGPCPLSGLQRPSDRRFRACRQEGPLPEVQTPFHHPGGTVSSTRRGEDRTGEPSSL